MASTNKRIVLAFSGGLDTSCILFWLLEEGYEVICYTSDVGQKDDFDRIKEQALELGAIKAIVEDCQKEFVDNYIYPSLSYGGIYQGRYLLGTSLARPCIAKAMVRVAQKENAGYISHGATGKGNDQVRFELSCAALDPTLKCIAPWRIPEFYNRFKGRLDLMKYAKDKGFEVKASPEKPYSIDANIMHMSYESGNLEDPMNPPDEDMFQMTKSPSQWPNNPEELIIYFKKGIPTQVCNLSTKETISDSLEILHYLNKIGGNHGIGRIDIVEDRFIGMKSRGIYETPGSTIIYTAIRDLEIMCLDKEINKTKSMLVGIFSEKVYNGLWFAPEGEYLRNCLDLSQKVVNGYVKLTLYKGCVNISGRHADNSLYDKELVSMEVQGRYTPIHAEGFIKTQAIRLNTYHYVHKLSE